MGYRSDNCYHVFYHPSDISLNETAILDGFIISGGSDNVFTKPRGYGGGMYNAGCSPTVTNCTFRWNTVYYGAGMYNDGSSPTVANCTFYTNEAEAGGGGMYNSGSSPTVTNCTFSGNMTGSAQTGGGGMCNAMFSSPTVTNCTFVGNKADNYLGGGMYNVRSSPTVTNCIFSNNETFFGNGSGMANFYQASPTVTNCIFIGNKADYGSGGGMWINYSCSPTVVNCTFYRNRAENGATLAFESHQPNPSSIQINNCILWDGPGWLWNDDGSTVSIRFSDIQGGFSGQGNIDADPNFVNPATNDLRLQAGSPCIDAGNTTAIPLGISQDLDGNPRILDDPRTPDTGFSILATAVDMGVYEFHPCPVTGDVNCDGVVDFKDLTILCANWLSGIEPEL
jgi:hypothetical protein